jgi:predicted MFS family arabinose efflux permease
VLLVAAGLALVAAVSLGYARFAYALLLPEMREALGWSYAQAATMNAANAGGYLAGALLAAPAAARLGIRRVCLGGTVLVAVSVLATAASSAFPVLLALRFVAGTAGGVAFVAGAAIAAELAAASGVASSLVVGIYTAGAGLAIAVSGTVVPAILATDIGGWRSGWIVLGLLAALSCLPALLAGRALRHSHAPAAVTLRWPVGALRPVLVAYGLFGAGYIGYMTFVVAFVEARAGGAPTVAAFWTLLGLAAVASAFIWRAPLTRLRGGRGPASVLATVTAGILILVVDGGVAATVASAVLFGGSFLAVVTAVTIVTQRALGPEQWAAALAGLTVSFASGQTAGPLLTGWISDAAGLRAGLLLSAALVGAAAALALSQPQRKLAASPGRLRALTKEQDA